MNASIYIYAYMQVMNMFANACLSLHSVGECVRPIQYKKLYT